MRSISSNKKKLAIDGGKPIREKFLVFGQPHISKEEIQEVVQTLKSGWIGSGPKVERFEQAFKEYIGCEHAMAVSSCTAGLHLALRACGIGAGDQVITTPMTFAATANTIINVGAEPVFVDCDKTTLNIDLSRIESAITDKTKAIIPVHFAGRPCDMPAIMDIAAQYKLYVIEDAAHAIEAVSQGKKVGTIGDLTCFSFYATKNITTAEGGMVTCQDDGLAENIKLHALHGLSKGAWRRFSDEGFKHYQVIYPGFKYNMTDIAASLGIQQLAKIERFHARRREIWDLYKEAFADLPVILPPGEAAGDLHAMHLFILLLDLEQLKADRDQIMEALYHENIGCGVHYVSLHLHPYYQERYGFVADDFPSAAWVSERTLSIPFSPHLSDNDIADVIAAVRKVLYWYAR